MTEKDEKHELFVGSCSHHPDDDVKACPLLAWTEGMDSWNSLYMITFPKIMVDSGVRGPWWMERRRYRGVALARLYCLPRRGN